MHFLGGLDDVHRVVGNALQVAYLLYLLVQQLFQLGMAKQMVDHVLPLLDGFQVFQGKQHPATQHA